MQNFIYAFDLAHFTITLDPLRLLSDASNYDILNRHFLLNGFKVGVKITNTFWDETLEELA